MKTIISKTDFHAIGAKGFIAGSPPTLQTIGDDDEFVVLNSEQLASIRETTEAHGGSSGFAADNLHFREGEFRVLEVTLPN